MRPQYSLSAGKLAPPPYVMDFASLGGLSFCAISEGDASAPPKLHPHA